jgi:5'(3')-deoxyribonucleotidase
MGQACFKFGAGRLAPYHDYLMLRSIQDTPMPTIALDFDDTLADTITPLLQWIEDNHGFRITDESLAVYGLGASRQQTSDLVEGFLADEAHNQIEAMEGAQESCQRFVAQGYRLIVVTARKQNHSRQTVELVERLFPKLITDIHFVGLQRDKLSTLQAIGANVFFEDHPRHFQEAADAGVPSILFGEHPWNRHVVTPSRARSWTEAALLTERLLKGAGQGA